VIVDPGMLPWPGGRTSLLKALEQVTDPRAAAASGITLPATGRQAAQAPPESTSQRPGPPCPP
jgi:hypothetical protein